CIPGMGASSPRLRKKESCASETSCRTCELRRRRLREPSKRAARSATLSHRAMTYCIGIKLAAGLVFVSDSRTNAGLDQISTFRKMIVYERPGDRFIVLLSSGNLSISQSVREILQVETLVGAHGEPLTIWN